MKHLLILCLLMIGCTRIIITEDGKSFEVNRWDVKSERKFTISTSPSYIEHLKNQSCTYAGYCAGCGFDFNMKMSCGIGFYYSCQGTFNATIESTPYVYQIEYDIKKIGKLYSEKRKAISTRTLNATSCQ